MGDVIYFPNSSKIINKQEVSQMIRNYLKVHERDIGWISKKIDMEEKILRNKINRGYLTEEDLVEMQPYLRYHMEAAYELCIAYDERLILSLQQSIMYERIEGEERQQALDFINKSVLSAKGLNKNVDEIIETLKYSYSVLEICDLLMDRKGELVGLIHPETEQFHLWYVTEVMDEMMIDKDMFIKKELEKLISEIE
ncbi:hypothetical protein [Clostridium cellulovorans]|uniref:Uncharacterized protein n=1 Tax=Clostridium cellulovorans (strain ATCC 35296 / DSM 3052 / OCM 3 / 743B) TaxID=573061 RepID=D9SRL0_CLOC7|nr:hypothetical protein [Clostridium cellulovorans]ADL52439.1 hypothetical protein Clocel_2742 [Clostridium cellulovorans 743B]